METPAGAPSGSATPAPGASPTASGTPSASGTPTASGTPGGGKVVKTASGLQYEIVAEGKGTVAEKGKHVFVHYTGTLTNGTKFDSSKDHGQPIDFDLGTGRVIKGWDEGIEGMKVGEKRKLTIPPDLAYGENSPTPLIPPNSILLFDVELVDVK